MTKIKYKCLKCNRHSGYIRKSTGDFHCVYCGADTKVLKPQKSIVPRPKNRIKCSNCGCCMHYRTRKRDYICRVCGSNHFV